MVCRSRERRPLILSSRRKRIATLLLPTNPLERKGIWGRGRGQTMERRTFLGGLTAASFGVMLENSFAVPAETGGPLAGRDSLKTSQVEVSGNTIFVRRYGDGPAILMVHGFPRTSLMWRFLAPKLAETHTVICVDLRAYGRSGIPASTDQHLPYSKRAMAKELVEVMDKLGFPTFTLIGHDRGGRVSYRMALDHPKNVERLAVFDVIPILEAWNRSDARFAQTYWPWILLSQKVSLPENYLLGAPEAVFHNPFGQGSFGPEILDEYVSTYRDPARVHGICEEYRAAATIDVQHDRADKEASKRIVCPMLRAFFYRVKARRGWGKAIMAVAHKILVFAYCILKNGKPYQDLGDN